MNDVETCLRFICECFLETNPTPSTRNVDERIKTYGHHSAKKSVSNDNVLTAKNNSFEVQNCYVTNESQPSCQTRIGQHEFSRPSMNESSSFVVDMEEQTLGRADIEKRLRDLEILGDETTSLELLNGAVQRLTNIYIYPVKSCAAFEVGN